MGYSDNLSKCPVEYLRNEIGRHELEISTHIHEMKMVRKALVEKGVSPQGMNRRYVIYSQVETNRQDPTEPMYWSNDDGWVDLASATVFTTEERWSFCTPSPDGAWIELPEQGEDVSPSAEQTRKLSMIAYRNICHSIALVHGFWDGSIQEGKSVISTPVARETIGMKLMLIVTELAEWMESVRHGDPASDHIPRFTTSEEEAADVLIRVFDLAGALDLRIAEALEAKIAYNRGREHMHGKTC